MMLSLIDEDWVCPARRPEGFMIEQRIAEQYFQLTLILLTPHSAHVGNEVKLYVTPVYLGGEKGEGAW